MSGLSSSFSPLSLGITVTLLAAAAAEEEEAAEDDPPPRGEGRS